jgi:hypothetical protein
MKNKMNIESFTLSETGVVLISDPQLLENVFGAGYPLIKQNVEPNSINLCPNLICR